MMKIIKYHIFLWLGVAVIFTAKAQVSENNPPAKSLKLLANNEYLGEIQEGEVLKHKFWVLNNGTEPVKINQAWPSCGCTVPVWPKDSIAPNDSAAIEITFDSEGRREMNEKHIIILSEAPELKYMFKVRVIPSPGQREEEHHHH